MKKYNIFIPFLTILLIVALISNFLEAYSFKWNQSSSAIHFGRDFSIYKNGIPPEDYIYQRAIAETRGYIYMFIYFYKEDSEECKRLETTSFESEELWAYPFAFFTAVKIDEKKDKITTKKYNVQRYPTIIFTKPDGREIERITGYASPDKLRDVAKKVIQTYPMNKYLELTRFNDELDGALPNYYLGCYYMDKMDIKKAMLFFKKVIKLDPEDKYGLAEITYLNLTYCLYINYQFKSQDKKIAHDALNGFKDFIKKYPDSLYKTEAQCNIGTIYANLDEKEKALSVLQKVLDTSHQGDWIEEATRTIEWINEK
ncbi:MAG: thioredoxin fold domain-containing protein [Candidatus Kappaea frigidicola]|nr:thioredoxin fold domain-containing protein [Candidatus Kappaea frigidicola]